MRKLYYIIIGVMALLLASCEQHNAKSTVKDFMETNLSDPSALSDVTFSDIDSTKYLNAQRIEKLRKQIDTTSDIYKKGITYGEMSKSGKLFLVRVKYKIGEADHQSTFYISDDFGAVVAFITN